MTGATEATLAGLSVSRETILGLEALEGLVRRWTLVSSPPMCRHGWAAAW